jgi:hypothetical protein
MLKSYRTGPLLNHRNHPQWSYHKLYLTRQLEIKKLRQRLQRLKQGYDAERTRVLRLRDSIPRLLGAGLVLPDFHQRPQLNLSFLEEFALKDIMSGKIVDHSSAGTVGVADRGSTLVERSFREALQALSDQHEAATNALQGRLAVLEQTMLPRMDDVFEPVVFVDAKRVSGEGFGPGSVGRTARRAAACLFGSIPRTRSWHPLHFIYQDISSGLEQAEGAHWGILFVGEKDGLSSRVGTRQRNPCFRISAAGLLRSEVEPAIDEPWCGLSVIELGRGDFQHLRRLHQAALPHMLPGGRILMFWVNHSCDADEALRRSLIQAAGMENEVVSVQFFMLTRGWRGLDLVKAVRGSSSPSTSGRGFAILTALQDLLRHHLLGQRPRVGNLNSGNCLGMTIEIEVAGRPPEGLRSCPPIGQRPYWQAKLTPTGVGSGLSW